MFAPTKTYRRWHRRVNVSQRRYALASAVAASGVPSLVMARGHVIDKLSEIPLVVEDKIEGYKKTKEAVRFMKSLNLFDDVLKVYNSKRMRAGKGKGRNRRWKQKLGPLIVYNRDHGLVRAFRNIPGVSTLPVDCLNLLKFAPGGHLGRLVLWTEGAFRKLDTIFGTEKTASTVKSGFVLPLPKMTNSDFDRLIHSDEIMKAVRLPRKNEKKAKAHGNPLKKRSLMVKLNPYAHVLRKIGVRASRPKVVVKTKEESASLPAADSGVQNIAD